MQFVCYLFCINPKIFGQYHGLVASKLGRFFSMINRFLTKGLSGLLRHLKIYKKTCICIFLHLGTYHILHTNPCLSFIHDFELSFPMHQISQELGILMIIFPFTQAIQPNNFQKDKLNYFEIFYTQPSINLHYLVHPLFAFKNASLSWALISPAFVRLPSQCCSIPLAIFPKYHLCWWGGLYGVGGKNPFCFIGVSIGCLGIVDSITVL